MQWLPHKRKFDKQTVWVWVCDKHAKSHCQETQEVRPTDLKHDACSCCIWERSARRILCPSFGDKN